jgi:hypothetical protein
MCFVTAGLLPGHFILAQEARTISYHIGNSRTLDYLATGDGTSFRSALPELAKLAGRPQHVVGFHINWGQPLKNILLNPHGNLTIGGIYTPTLWSNFLGGRFKTDELVVQPFWQPFSMVGTDGVTVFAPATLQSDVNAVEHWLSLIPAADDTRLFIAGISPTLADQTFDANGRLIDPSTDWLANTQWLARFDPVSDDRVVLTAAYYDALYQEIIQITDRKVSVIPSGRVFQELYERGYPVLDLYSDDLHINIAGELVESLTVAAVQFHLDPYSISYSDLPLEKYTHPLVNEAFFKLVQSAVREVINDYEYDSVTFVPEPTGVVLLVGMVVAVGAGSLGRKRIIQSPVAARESSNGRLPFWVTRSSRPGFCTRPVRRRPSTFAPA